MLLIAPALPDIPKDRTGYAGCELTTRDCQKLRVDAGTKNRLQQRTNLKPEASWQREICLPFGIVARVEKSDLHVLVLVQGGDRTARTLHNA